MSENRDYISQVVEKGSINVSEDVIAAIAAVAITDVEGIAGMAGSIGSEVADIIGKKSMKKGVRVSSEDGQVTVNAAAMVKYGYVIQDVARKAQLAVIEAVENMVGLKVKEVNIHVSGIAFSKEEQ